MAVSNDARGNSHRDGSWRNFLRHDRARPDNRAVTDGDAFQDDRTGADPDIVTDARRRRLQRLCSEIRFGARSMIVISDITVRPDHTPLTDDDRIRCVQHRESIDIRVRPDANSRCRLTFACGEKRDVVVEGNFVAESDIPRVSWNFDRLNPTSPTELNAPPTKPLTA